MCISCVQLFATPWNVACQAPLSMKFSRQEYWSGLPFPFPEYLPLDLSHCRQILYHLSRQGSPRLTWILIFSSLSLTGKHIWKKIFLKKEKNLKFSPLLNLLDSVATTTKSYFLTHFYNFCQICHRVTNSSTLAWKIPWTDELGGLQSMVSLRVGHDWATSLLLSLSCIGEENVNPLQCSCLENPKDRGAWWASVYGVAQSRTWLRRLSSSIIHNRQKSGNNTNVHQTINEWIKCVMSIWWTIIEHKKEWSADTEWML